MRSLRHLLLLSSFFLILIACTMPLIVFPTPVPVTPSAVPDPTATPVPLPATTLTFRVHLPADAPAASGVSLLLLDEVTGLELNPSPRAMQFAGGETWVVTFSAPVGSLLRYKYSVGGLDETLADRSPVGYRTERVTGDATREDWIAGRGGTIGTSPIGRIVGAVKDVNTGQGLPRIVVSAGGRQAFTGFGGGYALEGLPPGTQTLTAFAIDGSYQAFQQGAVVTANGTTPAEILLAEAKSVQVTFRVHLPADTVKGAAVYLAGNVYQLGNTFAAGPGGQPVLTGRQASPGSVPASRLPAMSAQPDGSHLFTLALHTGTDLRYKYTLGDGFWNAERDRQGLLRLRQFLVPNSDSVVDDTVDTWRAGPSSPITFQVSVPTTTPATDLVAIQFNPFGWLDPIPMWRSGQHDWTYVLYSPLDFGGEIGYRYCRNFACGAADEQGAHGAQSVGRPFIGTLLPQTLLDTVRRWTWWDAPPAYTPLLPPQIAARPDFQAGVELASDYRAEWRPLYAQTFSDLRADRANWTQVDTLWQATYSGASPRIFFSPDASPLRPDLLGLLNAAHSAGLKTALLPSLTPATGDLSAWWSIGSAAPGATGFWNEWFAQYRNLLLYHAQVAEETHTDVLFVGSYLLRPALPGEAEAPPDAEARWRALIGEVRARYHGRLAFQLLLRDTVSNAPPFLDAVDEIAVSVQSPLSDLTTPSIVEMQTNAGSLFDNQLKPLQPRFNKPLVLSAEYLSADGAASQCVRVGGDCRAFGDFSPFNPETGAATLDWPSGQADLSEQADIYNALLLAVNDRPWIGGFFAAEWFPPVALRDKSISTRGKPAEDVIKAWFSRLLGQ